MPNSELSDAALNEAMRAQVLQINVFPMSRIELIEHGVQVSGEGLWRWNVKGRGHNLRTGHSAPSAETAFVRALQAAREIDPRDCHPAVAPASTTSANLTYTWHSAPGIGTTR